MNLKNHLKVFQGTASVLRGMGVDFWQCRFVPEGYWGGVFPAGRGSVFSAVGEVYFPRAEGALFFEKVVEFAALFFCGAADLALAFAGVEAGGLELEAFDLFCGGDIDIVIDGL